MKFLLKIMIDFYEFVTGDPVLSSSTESLMEQQRQHEEELAENKFNFFSKKKLLVFSSIILVATGFVYFYDPNGVVIVKFLTDSFTNLSNLINSNSQASIETQRELATQLIQNQEASFLQFFENLKTYLDNNADSRKLAKLVSDVSRILATVTCNNPSPFANAKASPSSFPGQGVKLAQDPDKDDEADTGLDDM